MKSQKDILEEADKILEKIDVRGENVFLMAAARSKLTELYNELTKPKQNETFD